MDPSELGNLLKGATTLPLAIAAQAKCFKLLAEVEGDLFQAMDSEIRAELIEACRENCRAVRKLMMAFELLLRSDPFLRY